MRLTNPPDYFKATSYGDSHVVSADADIVRSEFRLTVTVAEPGGTVPSPSAEQDSRPRKTYDREFRRLTFLGVENLTRTKSRLLDGILAFNRADLSLRPEHLGAHSIDGIDVRRKQDRYSAAICVGTVGTYMFTFTAVEIDARYGRGIKVREGHWRYVDAETDQPFDFHNPFA